jgi:small multidrug resistance family-3 protein
VLRQGGSPWLLVPGALALAPFAWLLTRSDAVGALFALVGMAIIALQPATGR